MTSLCSTSLCLHVGCWLRADPFSGTTVEVAFFESAMKVFCAFFFHKSKNMNWAQTLVVFE